MSINTLHKGGDDDDDDDDNNNNNNNNNYNYNYYWIVLDIRRLFRFKK